MKRKSDAKTRESDAKTTKNTLNPKHLVSIRRIQEKYKESEGNTKLDFREKSGKDKKIRKRDDKNCQKNCESKCTIF